MLRRHFILLDYVDSAELTFDFLCKPGLDDRWRLLNAFTDPSPKNDIVLICSGAKFREIRVVDIS